MNEQLHPYSDLADTLWTEYLQALRSKGVLSKEARTLAGVLHTIGRDGWVMGGQSYTYGSNQNDLRTVRNWAQAYPDPGLAGWMVKALDDVQSGYCSKGYGGRRWAWSTDFALPTVEFRDGAIHVGVMCNSDLAFVHRDACYDHLSVRIYPEEPNWRIPKNERVQPIVRHSFSKGLWTASYPLSRLDPGRYFVTGGLVGYNGGNAAWDDLEIEWEGSGDGNDVLDSGDAGAVEPDGLDVLPMSTRIIEERAATSSSGKKSSIHTGESMNEQLLEEVDRIQPLLDHCTETRDLWTETQNPEHHQRWNHVISLIEQKFLTDAIDYADQWADKGWKPWQDLVEMIMEVQDAGK